MHVTMGDPTWAFVLVATEIWSSHSVTSRVSHFKNSPVFLPQLSVEICMHTGAHARNFVYRQARGYIHTNTQWLL